MNPTLSGGPGMSVTHTEDVGWYQVEHLSAPGTVRRAAMSLADRLGLGESQAGEVGMTALLQLKWVDEGESFALRQHGRQVAMALGLEPWDQVRVAVALSEVGRELLTVGSASVRFDVDLPSRCLMIVVRAPALADGSTPTTAFPGPPGDRTTAFPGPPGDRTTATGPGSGGPAGPSGLSAGVTGLSAARRLLDDLVVDLTPGSWTVTLVKRLPRSTPVDSWSLDTVRSRLKDLGPASPRGELRAQNAELVRTLDQLTARQQELSRVNAELEEANRGVVALYAELDERSRQVAGASEAKSRFLRSISHELRTPVNSIIGLGDLLGESELDREQRRQVDYLRGSARSLLGLVNELLDLDRAESGRETVLPAPVDLADLFAELFGTLRPVAESHRVVLTLPQPQVCTLVTDRELLARVLRNLLMNAVKFSPGGQVRLSATPRLPGRQLEITVRDTGIGIPAELQERIFEEFFQVPGELQQPGTGSGLGLAYARRVTERLGGTLSVTSRPGAGSTFSVVLPLRFPGRAGEGAAGTAPRSGRTREVLAPTIQQAAATRASAGEGTAQ